MNRSRAFRITLAALLALVVLVAAGIMVVRGRALHRFLLTELVERAQKAVGSRVEVGDFTLHPSTLRVDLYRIAIHGTESDARQPLLWADHLGVGLRIVSLWKRQFNLEEVLVDHPVAHITVDAQGHNNLPTTPSSSPQGSTRENVFNLAIRHVVLSQGDIYYNDRHIPLDAEAHDLQTLVTFDPRGPRYEGGLTYRQGKFQVSGVRPAPYDLAVRFWASPSAAEVTSLKLATGSSRITAQAHLDNYQHPIVDASYDVLVNTGDLKEILKGESLPQGEITTSGTAHYRDTGDVNFLKSISVQGKFGSPRLAISSPEAYTTAAALRGEYHLVNGALEAKNLQGDVLGGHVTAALSATNLAADPQGHLTATLSAIALEDIAAALRTRPQGNLQITGRLNAGVKADWLGRKGGLRASSDATLDASVAPSAEDGAKPDAIPVNATGHVSYDGHTGVLSVHQSSVHTTHTAVNLDGNIGGKSALGIKAKCDDLHEVDALRAAVRAAAEPNAGKSPLLGLVGSASFDGQVLGPLPRPRVVGSVSGANLRYQTVSLPSLAAGIELSPSAAAIHQAMLRTGAGGRVQLDGTVGLKGWSYSTENPINVRLSAHQIDVAEVARVANLHYPISGVLSVDLSAHGTALDPIGQGSIELSQAKLWGQQVQALGVRVQDAGSTVHSTLDFRTPAGSGNANVNYSLHDKRYDAKLNVPGIQLGQLAPLRARGLSVSGTVSVTAQGRGTLKSPELSATVEAPHLVLHGQELQGTKLQANAGGGRSNFKLESTVEGAHVQAQGGVVLSAGYDATMQIDTGRFRLDPLLAAYLPSYKAGLGGETELHCRMKGPLKHPEHIEAHLEIPLLSLAYQSLQLASVAPIRIDYQGATVSLHHSEFKGTDTALQLQAEVPLDPGGSVRAKAFGNVGLGIVQVFSSEVQSSGQFLVDVNVQGSRTHPEVRGNLRIVDAALQSASMPVGVEKLNAEFEAQGGRITIKSFSAQSGGGTLSARGFAAYEPTVQVSVEVSIKQVRLRYPEGLRAMLNGDVKMDGTPAAASVTGQVLVDRISFTQAFDLASFVDQFSGPSSSPSAGFLENTKLNVALKTTGQMGATSSELSVEGAADLHVVGTAADPVLVGRTTLTSGELFFSGHRFTVEHGSIEFTNPVRTEPVVNLVVTTTVNQFNINLNFVGPMERLRTTYTSDPPLPTVDIIRLLITGQTTEAAATNPSTPQSVLAGQVASQVSNRAQKMVGVSSLTIDPQLGGSGANPGARLAIQQRVTKNLFFTFATDVTTTQNVLVQVEYQFSRKYSLSTIRDQNGGYTVQVKMHKRF